MLSESFKNLETFLASLRGGLVIGYTSSRQFLVDIKICSVAVLKINWEIFGNSGGILVPSMLVQFCALILMFIWFFTVKPPDSE